MRKPRLGAQPVIAHPALKWLVLAREMPRSLSQSDQLGFFLSKRGHDYRCNRVIYLDGGGKGCSGHGGPPDRHFELTLLRGWSGAQNRYQTAGIFLFCKSVVLAALPTM